MKTLWIKNLSGLDVSVSDLGVKVPANKEVEVYAHNPYVTEEQVKRSMESGSLSKRLATKTLQVVKGPSKPRPTSLDRVNVSDKPIDIIKDKTSVVLGAVDPDVLEDTEFGSLFNAAELDKTANYARHGGAVVVEQKEGAPQAEVPIAKTELKIEGSSVGASTISVMTKQADSQSVVPTKEADVVARAPVDVKVPVVKVPKVKKPKAKKVENTVLMEPEAPKAEEAAKEVTAKNFDVRVATKNEDGAIVMELMKEVEEKAK